MRYAMILLTTFVVALPICADPLPRDGQQALLKGDWVTVLAVLEGAELQDGDAPCRMVAAHACLATNHNDEAMVLFLSAEERELAEWKEWTGGLMESNPGNAVSLYLHADALARSGDLAGAERCFTQAVHVTEESGLAWTALGGTRACLGRFDEAFLDLQHASAVDPSLAEAYASMGCLETLLCNAEGAYAAFNEALKINSQFALAYNGRGCARYGLGQPDEASLDFEMAQTLCPVLTVAEANRGFVLTMVAREVDKHTPPDGKPGTILDTESGSISSSPLLTPDGLEAAYQQRGFDSVHRELMIMKQENIAQSLEANRWMQEEYMPGVGRLNQALIATEATKSAVRVGKMVGILATGNLAMFWGQGAAYVIKDVVSSRRMDALPDGDREIAKTLLAGITKDLSYDPAAAFFEGSLLAAKGVIKYGQGILDLQATERLQSTAVNAAIARTIAESDQRLVAMEMARNPGAFEPTPASAMRQALTALSCSSTQPWSQLPELVKAVSPSSGRDNPVLIVGQDGVRAFACERMLTNRGISTVVTPPVTTEQLERLGSALQAGAIVGFQRDLDDSWRKLVPTNPSPPDPPKWTPRDRRNREWGMPLPTTTSHFPPPPPGASGTTVTLPVPSGFNAPSGAWDSFKPWTPKGNAGGVRTEDLEWVFVDKGSWPVMTFFTLAYCPPQRRN